MIRPACSDDLQVLLEMGARFVAAHYAAQIRANPDQMSRTAAWLMGGDGRILLVAEHAGVPIGMIGVACFDHPISGEKTAGELFWWCDPEHRGPGLKLLNTAKRWAKAQGATAMQLVAPNEKVAGFYERVGYVKVEAAYHCAL